jgi:hypothetical protein
MSKKYETSFQRFLAINIDRIKMTSIFYEVNRNGKRRIDYVQAKNYILNPKSKEIVIKPFSLILHMVIIMI